MQKRFVRLFGRRLAGTTALVATLALSASACSSNPEIVTVTTTLGQPLAPASQVAAPDLPSAGSSSTAPATAGTTNTATSSKATDPNNVRITATPTFGTKNLGPNNPIKITVFAATITNLTMTGNDSREVTGSLSSDKATWTTGQRLNYDTIYTVAGTALGSVG